VSVARSSSATATTGIAETPAPYCGRFAPSPTGLLHFGSLIAATGSFLEARTRQGRWLVRIEDLDPPREKPGATTAILAALERLGFAWDGPVWWQSTRAEYYDAALDRLRQEGLTRLCACSRAELKRLAQNRRRVQSDELYHPRDCVAGANGHAPSALRFRVSPGPVEFEDRSLGTLVVDVADEVGDFVLKRRDGLHAYQLAVVVDDAAQGVTDVVRGADLLSSTPRQILLQRSLGLPAATYLHLPLAVGADGTKLSKSRDAPSPSGETAGVQLWLALDWLGQRPPAELRGAGVGELWHWAFVHWRPDRFAGVLSRVVVDDRGGPSRLQGTEK